MKTIELIRQYAEVLRLTQIKRNPEAFIHQAQIDKPGYQDFIKQLLETEVVHRQRTDYERRYKISHP